MLRAAGALTTPLTTQAMLALQRTAGTPRSRSPAAPNARAQGHARTCCEPDEVSTPDFPGTSSDKPFTVAVDRESADWWESTGGGEVGHAWVNAHRRDRGPLPLRLLLRGEHVAVEDDPVKKKIKTADPEPSYTPDPVGFEPRPGSRDRAEGRTLDGHVPRHRPLPLRPARPHLVVSTWVAIKIGLEDAPALLGAGIRFAAAGVLLLGFAALRRRPLNTDRTLAVILGLLPFAFCYGLVYWGEQYIPSGLTAVLFGVMPLYTAILAALLLARRAAQRAAARRRRARARRPLAGVRGEPRAGQRGPRGDRRGRGRAVAARRRARQRRAQAARGRSSTRSCSTAGGCWSAVRCCWPGRRRRRTGATRCGARRRSARSSTSRSSAPRSRSWC